MRWNRRLRISLAALSLHRTRALLAVLSMAAGVAGVILTSAVSLGVEREIVRSMQSMGANLLIVRPAQVKRLAGREAIRGSATTLKVEDFLAIERLSGVARAAPGVERPMRVKAGPIVTAASVVGTTAAFASVRRIQLQRGRFFDDRESGGRARVAVLGSRVSNALFGDRDPLGAEVRIGSIPYEVIGVVQAKGVLADGSDEDSQVLIPLRTAMRRALNTTWLTLVFISAADEDQMERTAADLRRILRERHRLEEGEADDFEIQNTARSLELQRRTAASIRVTGLSLAGIAMLIGGTGILALMLVSVKERTGEIGLRMAVGATQRDILLQFMLEAATLASVGWVVGLALSAIGGGLVITATRWSLAAPGTALFWSFTITATFGLVFGLLPARQAARLHPIRALGMK